jgi:hypothetical protein
LDQRKKNGQGGKTCVKNCSQQKYAYVSGNEGLEECADVGHTWVERAVQSVCKNALKYVLMYGLAHI